MGFVFRDREEFNLPKSTGSRKYFKLSVGISVKFSFLEKMSRIETNLVASSNIRIPFLTLSWKALLLVSSEESDTSPWSWRALSNS